MDQEILSHLLSTTGLSEQGVVKINGPINLFRLMKLHDMVDRPDLKFPPFKAHLPPSLSERKSLFKQIAKKDFLLHHPHDSFTPIVDFLREAAEAGGLRNHLPFYRTSGDSPIVQALMDAARNGKQVTARLSNSTRFDDEDERFVVKTNGRGWNFWNVRTDGPQDPLQMLSSGEEREKQIKAVCSFGHGKPQSQVLQGVTLITACLRQRRLSPRIWQISSTR